MEQSEFCKRLVELRMNKGVSARDMSLSIGQSPGYINNIENGVNFPSMTAFFFICDYDTVLVGFPIWWYVAPTIINTFLESYDLQGKTIIPFATSGGSGMEQVSSHLAPSCVGAKLLLGKVFPSSVTKEETNTWFSKLQARLE